MADPRSIVIFAEPDTIVSDGLVPNAVKKINRIGRLNLEGIVDVKINSNPEHYTGKASYLKHYVSRLSEPKLLAWQTYRRIRGFRNANFPPYPSTLSWKGYDNSIHLTPTKNDIHHPDFISWLEQKNPDVILLLGCSKILGKQLIEIPTLCVVNYHWSYLPEYRGRHVTYWAAYNQEEYSGVTYHTIDSDIDQGTRINAGRVKIRNGGPTLAYDCIIKGRMLLTPILGAISKGHIPENGQIQGGEYFSLQRYRKANTEFDPSYGFKHNSQIISAKEESLVSLNNGLRIMITGLKPGSGTKAPGKYGEVLDVSFNGIKVNLGGKVHYINNIFHLPAYPPAKLLRIEEGMVIGQHES